eukprot:614643-Amphidinium_carterae.1
MICVHNHETPRALVAKVDCHSIVIAMPTIYFESQMNFTVTDQSSWLCHFGYKLWRLILGESHFRLSFLGAELGVLQEMTNEPVEL